jgi:hypothetical protein
MTEKEPDRTNRRPQIMNSDVQPKATPKLRERAPMAPKYLHSLIWIVMVVMALLVVFYFLTSK